MASATTAAASEGATADAAADLDLAQKVKSICETYDLSEGHGFLGCEAYDMNNYPNFNKFLLVFLNLQSKDGLYFRSLVDDITKQHLSQAYFDDLVDSLDYQFKKHVTSVFALICQKYVFGAGKDHIVHTVPFCIGYIWHKCSVARDLPTVVTLDSLVLNNWRFIDPERGFELDNIEIKSYPSSTDSESWFYKIHVAIEGTGGRMLTRMLLADEYTKTKADTMAFLADFKVTLKAVTTILRKMKVGCTPFDFWNIVRLYLSGFENRTVFPKGGARIEGTDIMLSYKGGSAAQSTLIQSFDTFFGVKYELKHAEDFLIEMQGYMPIKHREYLHALVDKREHGGSMRDIVLRYDDAEVTEMYNVCLALLEDFRKVHVDIVHRYIVDFAVAEKEALKKGDARMHKTLSQNNINAANGTGGIADEKAYSEKGVHPLLAMLSTFHKNINKHRLTVTELVPAGFDGKQLSSRLTSFIVVAAFAVLSVVIARNAAGSTR